MFDPSPDLIDYHCHLDLYQDYAEQFQRCEQEKIATLAVTTTPRAWERNNELSKGTHYIRIGLGFHPQLVMTQEAELPLFEKLLREARFIGEIGLDASPRYYKSLPKQKKVLERILRSCADAGGKILSVHSVRTGHQLLDLIEEHLPPSRGKVVMHWFSGTPAEAERAIQLGCYFSINREMFKKTGRSSLLKFLPINRLLTESDGPFTLFNNRPSQPEDIKYLIPMIGNAVNLTEQQINYQLVQNLITLEGASEITDSFCNLPLQ